MENQNVKSVKEKIKSIAKHAGTIAIITSALFVGFLCGEFYTSAREARKQTAPLSAKKVHNLNETSIAINERNELLIIDRSTGAYEIYEDSVGKTIFRLYASQMVSSVSAEK